jgi:uncharacterized damage-inducible protein DinB
VKTHSILHDLYAHNDWANRKVLGACETLSDEQLDAVRPIGFGSLRNTLFHILEAEKLWLERWLGEPWRPLQPDANGLSVKEIRAQAETTAERRNRLLDEESQCGFSRVVEFSNSSGESYAFPIGDLMNHVSNHGIHHRSQALQYLKGFEKTFPGGLDYVFFKLAASSCSLPEESLEPLRAYGLEANSQPGSKVLFEAGRLQRYLAYSDWAMNRVYEEAAKLAESQLDVDLNIGTGTLRGNLQHMNHAEEWWLENWKQDQAPFPTTENPQSLAELRDEYTRLSNARNQFVESLDADSADRVVSVTAGGPISCFRVSESLLQLACHGTHHRGQCVNMLRQFDVTFGWIDFFIWILERN